MRTEGLFLTRFLQTNVRGGHFIKEDIGLFDAAFFNYSAELASVCGIGTSQRTVALQEIPSSYVTNV